MKLLNLRIGGKTSFDEKYDIIILFKDVFFLQCNYEWHTSISEKLFFIPGIEESKNININFSIEQGYNLFKIIAEDINNPFYISAKNISIEKS